MRGRVRRMAHEELLKLFRGIRRLAFNQKGIRQF